MLWAGLALLAMVAISVALSAIRLVLVELLDPSDPARATVVDPAAA